MRTADQLRADNGRLRRYLVTFQTQNTILRNALTQACRSCGCTEEERIHGHILECQVPIWEEILSAPVPQAPPPASYMEPKDKDDAVKQLKSEADNPEIPEPAPAATPPAPPTGYLDAT